MEKYTMFMDWKNQYSENEYPTQMQFTFKRENYKFLYQYQRKNSTGPVVLE